MGEETPGDFVPDFIRLFERDGRLAALRGSTTHTMLLDFFRQDPMCFDEALVRLHTRRTEALHHQLHLSTARPFARHRTPRTSSRDASKNEHQDHLASLPTRRGQQSARTLPNSPTSSRRSSRHLPPSTTLPRQYTSQREAYVGIEEGNNENEPTTVPVTSTAALELTDAAEDEIVAKAQLSSPEFPVNRALKPGGDHMRQQRSSERSSEAREGHPSSKFSLHEKQTEYADLRAVTASSPAWEGPEYFFTDFNRATRLPAWIVRRSEFTRVLQQDTAGGDLQVRDALRLAPHSRRGGPLALLHRWLRQRSPYLASLSDSQLTPLARAVTLVHLAGGERLEPEPGAVYFVLAGRALYAEGLRVRWLDEGDAVGYTGWLRELERGLVGREGRVGDRMDVVLAKARREMEKEAQAAAHSRQRAAALVAARRKAEKQAEEEVLLEEMGLTRGRHRGPIEPQDDTKEEDNQNFSEFPDIGSKGWPAVPETTSAPDDPNRQTLSARQARTQARRNLLQRAVKSTQRRVAASGAAGGPVVGIIIAARDTSAAADALTEGTKPKLLDSNGALPEEGVEEAMGSRLKGPARGVELVRLSLDNFERSVSAEIHWEARRIASYLNAFVPQFSGWPFPRLLTLARCLERRSFRAGDAILKQGDPSLALALLRSGGAEAVMEVDLRDSHRIPTGRHTWRQVSRSRPVDVTVRHIAPHEWFGEESVFWLLGAPSSPVAGVAATRQDPSPSTPQPPPTPASAGNRLLSVAAHRFVASKHGRRQSMEGKSALGRMLEEAEEDGARSPTPPKGEGGGGGGGGGGGRGRRERRPSLWQRMKERLANTPEPGHDSDSRGASSPTPPPPAQSVPFIDKDIAMLGRLARRLSTGPPEEGAAPQEPWTARRKRSMRITRPCTVYATQDSEVLFLRPDHFHLLLPRHRRQSVTGPSESDAKRSIAHPSDELQERLVEHLRHLAEEQPKPDAVARHQQRMLRTAVATRSVVRQTYGPKGAARRGLGVRGARGVREEKRIPHPTVSEPASPRIRHMDEMLGIGSFAMASPAARVSQEEPGWSRVLQRPSLLSANASDAFDLSRVRLPLVSIAPSEQRLLASVAQKAGAVRRTEGGGAEEGRRASSARPSSPSAAAAITLETAAAHWHAERERIVSREGGERAVQSARGSGYVPFGLASRLPSTMDRVHLPLSARRGRGRKLLAHSASDWGGVERFMPAPPPRAYDFRRLDGNELAELMDSAVQGGREEKGERRRGGVRGEEEERGTLFEVDSDEDLPQHEWDVLVGSTASVPRPPPRRPSHRAQQPSPLRPGRRLRHPSSTQIAPPPRSPSPGASSLGSWRDAPKQEPPPVPRLPLERVRKAREEDEEGEEVPVEWRAAVEQWRSGMPVAVAAPSPVSARDLEEAAMAQPEGLGTNRSWDAVKRRRRRAEDWNRARFGRRWGAPPRSRSPLGKPIRVTQSVIALRGADSVVPETVEGSESAAPSESPSPMRIRARTP